LGVERIIWLPQGLYSDETDGHVDNFCCFVKPGEVLLAWTDDAEDPNHARCQAALSVLEQATDARGRSLTVHRIPLPGPIHATAEECAGVEPLPGTQQRSPEIRLAGSYVNFLIVNGGIIAPASGDPQDPSARQILEQYSSVPCIVMVPEQEILCGGADNHSDTQ